MEISRDGVERIVAVRDEALDRLDPARLTANVVESESLDVARFDLLAVGKCAAGMIAGALRQSAGTPGRILGCIPRGYVSPDIGEVVEGSHPLPDAASFAAGQRVLSFVDAAERPVLLLLSGGGSACVEVAAEGITVDEVTALNRELLSSGLSITKINAVRRRISAIKGGALGRRLPPGSFVVIHPDVPAGREKDVASSPAFTDPSGPAAALATLHELGTPLAMRIADRLDRAGGTGVPDPPWKLTISSSEVPAVVAAAARDRGWGPVPAADEWSIDGPVDEIARTIHERLSSCASRALLVGVGEPVVRVHGGGRGGRCSELAARLSLLAIESGMEIHGVVSSTDGVDGLSGLAGVHLDSRTWGDRAPLALEIELAIASSDTASVAERLGGAPGMRPTGNNLRDLVLLSCG